MPWPSSAVNSGLRRFSQAHGITETRRNSQPKCSTAFCSSPVGRPDLQSQAKRIAQIPGDRLQDERRLEVTALEVVLGPTLQPLGNRTQDHQVPPNRRAKLTAMPDEPSTPQICDRPLPSTSPFIPLR